MFREQALRHISLEYCATEVIKLPTFPRQRPGNELSQNAEMLSTQLQAYTTATDSLHIYKSTARIRPVYYPAQPPRHNELFHEQSSSSLTAK